MGTCLMISQFFWTSFTSLCWIAFARAPGFLAASRTVFSWGRFSACPGCRDEICPLWFCLWCNLCLSQEPDPLQSIKVPSRGHCPNRPADGLRHARWYLKNGWAETREVLLSKAFSNGSACGCASSSSRKSIHKKIARGSGHSESAIGIRFASNPAPTLYALATPSGARRT